MNLSIILQAIAAIPKIVGLVYSVIKAIRAAQERMKESALAEAVLKAQGAKEAKQVGSVVEDIAKNLP